MSKQNENKDGTLKSSAARRSRSGRAGKGSTVPRVMILGLLVVVAGGAALFWPRGGSVPTGIGENQTVVSSPSVPPDSGSTPHSGDVDINEASPPELTPEAESGTAGTTTPTETKPAEATAESVQKSVQQPVTKPVAKPVEKASTTQPAVKKSQPAATTVTKVEPQSTGPYAVQVGAFGKAENADQEAARLKAKGWDARVRAGNNSKGDMVFRVWIGYFASRALAQKFIDQNSRHLAGAIPVHR